MAGCTRAPEAVARAAAVGAADADGRRQPGDHAGAQHGHHRLDDRRRRPRLRRAAGAARAQDRRRRMEAGLAIVALAIALDRLSQAAATQHAGVHGDDEARASGSAIRTCRWRSSCSLVTTLLSLVIPGLRRRAEGDHHLDRRACWKAAVDLDHRQLLRRHRSLPRRPDPLRPQSGARLLRGLPLARRRVPARRSPASSSAARGLPRSVAAADRLLRRHRPVGKDHGDGLSVRHLGRHRLPDRHSARALRHRAATASRRSSRRSSTRCRCCRPSASSSRW